MTSAAMAASASRAREGRLVWSHAPPAVVGGLAVAGLGFSFGGYFPSTWGWATLGLAWVAAAALLVRPEVRLGGHELVLLGALAALAIWIGLSILWSTRVPQTVLELERVLVYVTAVGAVLVAARSRAAGALVGGTLVGLVAVVGFGLAARLFPEHVGQIEDEIGGFRLDEPVGYWNALGILAAMAILLALGVAAAGANVAVRSAAAASTVVLLPTLYFTFGRGPWYALVIGLVVLVAVSARRLRMLTLLLVLGPVPGAAVLIAAQSGPLSEKGAALADVAREGERYALIVVSLALVAAAVVFVFAWLERIVRVPRAAASAWAALLAAAAIAVLTVVFVRYGGPLTLADKAYESFKSPPVGVATGQSGSKRLFTLSSNGRIDTWSAAWDDFAQDPLLGSGAGTFEHYWLQHRPAPLVVVDAHSLYAETLGELGVVGILLLGVALAVPLVAAARGRRRRLTPAVTAAYVAFVVHAGVDWDWEMPAVVVAALLCGVVLLLGARPRGYVWEVGRIGRGVGAGLALALAAFAFVGIVGNTAVRNSEEALFQDGDAARAVDEARRATTWAPWSSDAWLWRSRAEAASGLEAARLDSIREAIDRDPNNWELWLDLAYSYEHEDPATRPARVAAVRRAFALNPLAPELELAFRDEELGVTLEDVQAR